MTQQPITIIKKEITLKSICGTSTVGEVASALGISNDEVYSIRKKFIKLHPESILAKYIKDEKEKFDVQRFRSLPTNGWVELILTQFSSEIITIKII